VFEPIVNLQAMTPNLTYCRRFLLSVGFLLFLVVVFGAQAQTCYTGAEIDAVTAKSLEVAAQQYLTMSAQGDVAGLRANAIPQVTGNFGAIERAVVTNKQFFAQGKPSGTQTFVLDASDAKTAMQRADFFCGIYNSPDRVVFSIPNLPPGRYAVSIAKITGKDPITLTLILQDTGKNSWKLAGYYARLNSIGEHDGQWYLSKAREYKGRGQLHNAWFYYLTAWDLIAPVNFMSTPQLDKLADEIQAARPSDLPGARAPMELPAKGKTFKVTDVTPVPAGNDLDLRVQYETGDASNPTQASQDNAAVMKALLAKYPELRDAFNLLIARATDSLGHDYETLTPMKDVQ
jgi:hypothetical protein